MATVPPAERLIGRVQTSGPSAAKKMSVSYPRSTSKRLLAGSVAAVKCRITNLVPLDAGVGEKFVSHVLADVGGRPESGPKVIVGESVCIVPIRCDMKEPLSFSGNYETPIAKAYARICASRSREDQMNRYLPTQFIEGCFPSTMRCNSLLRFSGLGRLSKSDPLRVVNRVKRTSRLRRTHRCRETWNQFNFRTTHS